MIDHVGNDTRRIFQRQRLEFHIERLLFRFGAGSARGLEDAVHFRVLVVPQRGVPRSVAVIPRIDRRIDRRPAVEPVDIEGLLAFDLVDELVPRNPLDVDPDVEGFQHLAHGEANALARGTPHGRVDGDVEAVREARFRQQLLRRGHIRLADLDVIVVERMPGRDHRVGGRAVTEQRQFDHRRLVDRHRNGVANARIVERLVCAVHDDAVPGRRRDGIDHQIRILLELLDGLQRQVPHEVDLAILDSGRLGGAFRHDPHDHQVKLRHALDVIVRILLHLDAIAGRERFQLERPGARRRSRQRIEPIARNDSRLPVAEDVGQARVGCPQGEAHSVGVECLHLFDQLEVHTGHASGGFVLDARHGGDDVLRIELTTVMKLDAFAQIKRPRLEVVAGCPPFREIRLDLPVAADFGQAAEHQKIDDVLLADLGLRGIQRVQIGAHRQL